MNTHLEDWGKCQSCEFIANIKHLVGRWLALGLMLRVLPRVRNDPQEAKSSGKQKCSSSRFVLQGQGGGRAQGQSLEGGVGACMTEGGEGAPKREWHMQEQGGVGKAVG